MFHHFFNSPDLIIVHDLVLHTFSHLPMVHGTVVWGPFLLSFQGPKVVGLSGGFDNIALTFSHETCLWQCTVLWFSLDTILANIHVRCNFAQPMFHLIEKFELLHRPWKLQEPMSKTGVVKKWKDLPSRATLSSLRTCWTLKTVVKRKFFTWPSDPFVTSDVSDVQNCGKTQIFYVAERPFRHFGRVGRPKLR